MIRLDWISTKYQSLNLHTVRYKYNCRMKNVNEMDHFGMVDTKNPDSKVIDLKLLSVQSCKVQKSRSLDSKLKGERQTKLKVNLSFGEGFFGNDRKLSEFLFRVTVWTRRC